jgi:hypothetical protein
MIDMKLSIPLARLLGSLALISSIAFSSEITPKSVSSAPVPVDLAGRRVESFENGFITSVATTLGEIWVFNETGRKVRDVRVVLPDADLERINDVAISREGRIAVAVTAYTKDGKFAKALAWIDSDGNVEKLVRTSPFAVREIRFANDGTLWALGDVYDETITNQPVPPYDVLWQFDAQGHRIRTALPKASFKTNSQVASQAELTVAGNTVAVYFKPQRELVEVSSSGETLGRWAVPAPEANRAEFVRMALTPSGDLLLEQKEESGGDSTHALHAYFFERQSGKLSTVNLSAVDGTYIIMLGAKGDNILWRSYREGSFTLTRTEFPR